MAVQMKEFEEPSQLFYLFQAWEVPQSKFFCIYVAHAPSCIAAKVIVAPNMYDPVSGSFSWQIK